MGLGELLFFSIWLLGWTAGVSWIQHDVLTGGLQSELLLFLFTHGGAEVVVLWALSSRIRGAAENQVEAPEIRRDHASMQASWTPGSGNLALAGFGALLGLVVFPILIGVPLSLVPALPVARQALAVGLCVVWAAMGLRWAKALTAHLSRDAVHLDADLDRVRIETGGCEPVELPLVGLDASAVGDSLSLSSGGTYWYEGCKEGPERDELVTALQTMAERATPARQPDEPESLRQIRSPGRETD